MAAFAVQGVPGVIAYLRPSHARPDAPLLMIKRPSYPKGFQPPQLKAYAGQTGPAGRKCKGRTGQGFRLCMVKETVGLRRGVAPARRHRSGEE